MTIGPPPQLRHFSDSSRRAQIAVLRERVAPILANNLLPHFTDHSVAHSDSVTELVDELLQQSKHPLSDLELLILYSSCYLHDIGMQYERAESTRIIQSLNLVPPWQDRLDEDRRELLRQFHHRISAEMVQSSADSARPTIGIQLTADFHAAYIAALCHAHCIDTDSIEYENLVEDGPNIRMSLLSALLRIADILDESRRRATREKERTLLLSLESQTHWWRHYYTESVTFDAEKRSISIWFDFPADNIDEFKTVVPELQMPWIEAELRRHNSVLLANGCQWYLKHESQAKAYSTTERMPDDVLTAMLKQLALRRKRTEEEQSYLSLMQLREARPSIRRRLAALNEQKVILKAGEYLIEFSKIAADLYELGGRSAARSSLSSYFTDGLGELSVDERFRIGQQLLNWQIEARNEREAFLLLEKLDPEFSLLPNNDERKWQFTKAKIKALELACAQSDAESSIEAALSWAPHSDRPGLEADLVEMRLLRGELEQKRPRSDA